MDIKNPYTYNAEYTDASTGNQYLRARYYDPEEGTFLTQDSYLGSLLEPLSQNLYTYAENNPVNYSDPSGHGILSKIKSAAKKVATTVKNTYNKAKTWVKTQEDYYETKLINGEEKGLIVELKGRNNMLCLRFGSVKAVRMIDEGIVQTDIYSKREVQKYKKERFKNVIYEIVGGRFKDEITSIADGYLDVIDVKHYIIITMNYNIDIISEWAPEIEIL